MFRQTQPIEPQPAAHPSGAAPLAVWLLLQIAALLTPALRMSLWARPASPSDAYALQFMLVAQFAGSALLFPWLMQSRRVALSILLFSTPFLQLAGLMGQAPMGEVIRNAIAVAIWLVSLWLTAISLRTLVARMTAVAVASMVVIGGLGWIYLRGEFSSAGRLDPQTLQYPVVLSALLVSAILALISRRFP